MAVTVLDGSTFVVCDQRGDVDGIADASGFFAADTRFLSRLVLTVGGERSEPISLEQAAPHVALSCCCARCSSSSPTRTPVRCA